MNGQEYVGPITHVSTEVARIYGITLAQLMGPQKRRSLTWPRQVAMYIAHQKTGQSTTQIGRVLGGRDHTTVIKGIRRVRTEMERDPERAVEVARVIDAICEDTFLNLIAETLTEEKRRQLIASLRQTIADCTLTLRSLGVEVTDGAS